MISLAIISCTPKQEIIAYKCPTIILANDPVIKGKLDNTSKPNEVIKFWVVRAKAYKKWHDVTVYQIKRVNTK